MSIMLVAVVILSVWVVRRLTARLATFARAAERLGVDVSAPRLPESGPREVRQAARAFNEMQRRIRRFVEDRTQMVAAIAHDLGTPITRLRLRAEYVGDEEQRRKVLADLDEMERMIASTLSFVRDETATEPRQTFDLVSLLQSVCDDLSDAGHTIGFHSEGRLPYECRPIALRRALTNVIENAVKFGNQAWVSLDARDDTVLIAIDDDGPGIPEQYHADVFKPFQRLEDSRSRETGGTGLGLTVARTIVRAHGGDITLNNRSEGGLRVNILLPR
jgi:signal transduction histidine kinase